MLRARFIRFGHLLGAGGLAVLIVLLFVRSLAIPLFVSEDGSEYLTYASILASGSWSELNEFNRCVLRSPLYPMLLAVCKMLLPEAVDAVRMLHAIVGLGTIAIVSRLLRSWCYELITAFLVIFVFVEVRVFFLAVLTEWSAICLLITFFAVLARYFGSPKPTTLFIVTILCSLAVLLRSALLPTCIFPIILMIRSRKVFKIEWVLAVLLGFVPIILLLLVNSIYLRSATISPLGGIVLFGMTTLIEEPLVDENSTPELRAFVVKFRAVRYPRIDQESGKSFPVSLEGIANRNMWEAGEGVRQALDWSYVQYSKVGVEYGMLAIFQHPLVYGRLLIDQWASSLDYLDLLDWVLIICWLGCLTLGIKSQEIKPVVIGSLFAVALHLGAIVFNSITQPTMFRLVAVTLMPFQFSMYSLCASTLIARYRAKAGKAVE